MDAEHAAKVADIVRDGIDWADVFALSELPLSAGRWRTFFRSENQLAMRRDGVVVELHWAVERHAFAVHLDLASIWRRAERVCVAGRELAHPSPEDLMILLCIHGAKHE